MISTSAIRQKPTCKRCGERTLGHRRQGGRLVCPGGLDPPTTTRPRKRSRELYEDEGSDSDDPLLLKPLSSDEARPPVSRKRRASYQYDRDCYGDEEERDGRDAPVLTARAREIVAQNLCVRQLARIGVRFTSEPAPNLRFLAPAFDPGTALEPAQDEGTRTESDGAGRYSVHDERSVAGDEQEDDEGDETRTHTGADDDEDDETRTQTGPDDDETRTQTGADDHNEGWRAQGSLCASSQTLLVHTKPGSRAGSFTARWVSIHAKGKRIARSAPESDHSATPTRPASRVSALCYASSGHGKRQRLEFGTLPQETALRDIREWASNIPTNPSGRHGTRSHADDDDDAGSQFEFGMPATVPFPPPIVALPGPDVITLAPARPASPTLSSSSTTDRSSTTEDSVRSLDDPLTPAMAAAQAPFHYLERVLRAASVPIACLCWVPTASVARASLDIARAGLFVSLSYDAHDGVWIVVADTPRKLEWVLVHSDVLARASLLARIGDLPWGAPPAAVEAAIEAGSEAEVPVYPAQFMGGQLGGVVVWCNANDMPIA